MLTVATWNVERVKPRSWRRLPIVQEALSGRSHDVLVLTESHIAVRPRSGMSLVAQSTPAPDRTWQERWVCIWVADSAQATPLELREEPERSAAALVCSDGFAPLIVFGSVLPWRGDGRQEGRGGAAAFVSSLAAQSADLRRLRSLHPSAPVCVLGDLNQEFEEDGPVGTAAGRRALREFLADHRLVAVTGGVYDPLLRRGWRESIDHILVSEEIASRAGSSVAWPDQFPLPGSPWPDHHGVEVSLAAV